MKKPGQLEELNLCNSCGSETIRPLDRINNLWVCDNCGYIFDNPRPNSIRIERYYSDTDNYDFWLDEEKERNDMWQRRLSIIRRFVKDGELLDVGTGTGQFLSEAKKYFQVSGTEVSSKAIDIGKRRYNLDILHGELGRISFDRKFNVITLFHVLEHVPSPMQTIKQCYELLDNGGYIVIAVPNDVDVWKRLVKSMLSTLGAGKYKNYGFGIRGIQMDGKTGEIHLSHFRPATLKYLVERQGFDTKYQGLDPYLPKMETKDILALKIFQAINHIARKNLYDTQLLIAKK